MTLDRGTPAAAGIALVSVVPHDFRRTTVSDLERAGLPRSTAMAMTGHRTESIYRRYAIVDEVMLHWLTGKPLPQTGS